MMSPALYVSVTVHSTVLSHSRELILVGVAELLEYGCCRLCRRGLVVGSAVHAQVVVNNVCHSLCVRC